MKIFQTIRTHPKKIIFFSSILGFGGRWLYNQNQDETLRKRLSEKILPIGRQPFRLDFTSKFQNQNAGTSPPRILVLLNPKAGKSKSNKFYKKNGEPLLHLTGSAVTLLEEESVNQLASCCSVLDNKDTDYVLIAGGDGTLHHAVNAIQKSTLQHLKTGDSVPLCMLPLGLHCHAFPRFYEAAKRQSQLVSQLQLAVDENPISFADRQAKIRDAYRAVRLCISGRSTPLNLIQVDGLRKWKPASTESEPAEEQPIEPAFAVATLKFGRYVTAEKNADRFWLLGPLRYGCALIKERFSRAASLDTRTVRIRMLHRCESNCEACRQLERQQYGKQQQQQQQNTSSSQQPKSYFSRLFSSGSSKLGSSPNRAEDAAFSGFLDCPNARETVIEAVQIDDLTLRFVDEGLTLSLGDAEANVFSFVRNGLRSRNLRFEQPSYRTFENLNELVVEFVGQCDGSQQLTQTKPEEDKSSPVAASDKLNLFIDGEKYEVAERAIRVKLIRNAINVCTAPLQELS